MAVVVVLLIFLGMTVICWPFVIDDAFISIRYAENLVHGYGLVFNPGERVEGYTNFLWVLILAAAHALGGESILWAKILGIVANLATLCLVTVAGYRPRLYPTISGLILVPALLLATNFGFVLWGVGGLETPLFTCLVTAGLLLLIEDASRSPRFPWSALCFALATLARPDGAVLFAGGLLSLTAWSLFQRRFNRTFLRYLLVCGSLYGLIVGSHLIFRYLYYGAWVPNTVHVKVSTDAYFEIHWDQLVTWLRPWGLLDPAVLAPFDTLLPGWPAWWRSAVALATVPALWLALVGLLRGRKHPWAWVLGGTGALWMLYLARVYDDWMPGWRFYVPIVPTVTILMVAGLDTFACSILRWRRRIARVLGSTALVGIVAALLTLSVRDTLGEIPVIQGHAYIQAHYRAAGEYLRAHAPPGTVLAVIDAGAIPYYSGLYTIDYGGLADAHMAQVPFRPITLDKGDGILRHYDMRYDPAYLLGRQPGIVQLSGRITPDGQYIGHLPELALIYNTMKPTSTYDLTNPILYDESVQLILVRRNDLPWPR